MHPVYCNLVCSHSRVVHAPSVVCAMLTLCEVYSCVLVCWVSVQTLIKCGPVCVVYVYTPIEVHPCVLYVYALTQAHSSKQAQLLLGRVGECPLHTRRPVPRGPAWCRPARGRGWGGRGHRGGIDATRHTLGPCSWQAALASPLGICGQWQCPGYLSLRLL